MKANLKSLDLAIIQYQEIKKLKLKGSERDQIERAALSVCLNLSEGDARRTRIDRQRFFNISYSSQKEVMVILKILANQELWIKADKIAACLFQLQRKAW